MILTIDVGNTNVKVAVFKQFNLVDKFVFQKNNFQNNFQIIFKKHPNHAKAVLSSVSLLDEKDSVWLKNQVEVIEINADSIFPFKNEYTTPNTLGIDRRVLASGAVLQYPNQDVLIIDAGSIKKMQKLGLEVPQLFEDTEEQMSLYQTMDYLKNRFGADAVGRASGFDFEK